MQIRTATIKDILNIANLHAESWRDNYHPVLTDEYLNVIVFNERTQAWTERLENPTENQLVLVAEVDGAFSGFICAYGANDPQYGTIVDNLHVMPNIKGQGIGSALLGAVAKWAKENYQEHGLYLEVLECNPKAIAFYEHLGANRAKIAYWHTPCDTQAKEYFYCWYSLDELIKRTI